MLLAVDVGNTNLTVGLIAGDRIVRQWRLITHPRRRVDWYVRALRCPARTFAEPEAAVYGSVVPPWDKTLERAIKKAFGLKAVAVTPKSKLGFKLRVSLPGQVGADRVLNALAAKRLVGAPAIVIDFGTAVTFDCVDAAGDYIGGAILPGPGCAARALHEFTAKLPLVKPRKPARAVGKDTVSCLESGLYFGCVGMVREVLARIRAEMSGEPAVIATGGPAPLFLGDIRGLRHEPDLTLHGLRFAHDILHHGAAR